MVFMGAATRQQGVSMIALILQLAGLVGLPVGGFLVADLGGAVIGTSISFIYVGAAVDQAVRGR